MLLNLILNFWHFSASCSYKKVLVKECSIIIFIMIMIIIVIVIVIVIIIVTISNSSSSSITVNSKQICIPKLTSYLRPTQ